ncbi:putative glycolipid-binding domain-containing protein [Streptomyces sp. RFCAC02]|uniref:putative glycolipid-binding domain-containing protein n=1 Tax=Streptomyces sp. RFCAC02 TaxID=2499143 RepID=UPI00102245AF|nr:putative glycolipid-binding domain-containing protein [Streptomyces sp. RFCAC02]
MRTEVVWTSLRWAGIEHIVWTRDRDGTAHAASVAVHALPEGTAHVRYDLATDEAGHPRHVSVGVSGPSGDRHLSLTHDGRGTWTGADGRPLPELAGCTDVDISCTPLTNTLPINRLAAATLPTADLRVAYVTVPTLEVRPVGQRYTRLTTGGTQAAYRYRSASFTADLTVDGHGLVIDYPGGWRRAGGPPDPPRSAP